jgi:hypothetical protein
VRRHQDPHLDRVGYVPRGTLFEQQSDSVEEIVVGVVRQELDEEAPGPPIDPKLVDYLLKIQIGIAQISSQVGHVTATRVRRDLTWKPPYLRRNFARI